MLRLLPHLLRYRLLYFGRKVGFEKEEKLGKINIFYASLYRQINN